MPRIPHNHWQYKKSTKTSKMLPSLGRSLPMSHDCATSAGVRPPSPKRKHPQATNPTPFGANGLNGTNGSYQPGSSYLPQAPAGQEALQMPMHPMQMHPMMQQFQPMPFQPMPQAVSQVQGQQPQGPYFNAMPCQNVLGRSYANVPTFPSYPGQPGSLPTAPMWNGSRSPNF